MTHERVWQCGHENENGKKMQPDKHLHQQRGARQRQRNQPSHRGRPGRPDDHRRYAKRQLTWFGADSEIIWKTPQQIEEIIHLVQKFMS